MGRKLASILVGDHLGQVKKVLWPSGEITILPDFAEPSKDNPIVSIQPIGGNPRKYLIGNRNGNLFVYDSIKGKAKECSNNGNDSLVGALPINDKDVVFIYDQLLSFDLSNRTGLLDVKLKKGLIRNARVSKGNLAIVGKDIPLKVFDTKTRNKIYEADLPDKDWLGLQPDCEVVGLDFVGDDHIVTCSKSDSVIRVYNIKSSNTRPSISINLDQTAFNEYAEAGRFMSVATSTGDSSPHNRTIVAGSNVGQLIAIELRLNVKHKPKKRLQPNNFKVLGGFKGARGASFKDIKVIKAHGEDENTDLKVISCCLDRYLRVHNMSRTTGRHLDKHIYMKTKPVCCAPVFYEEI